MSTSTATLRTLSIWLLTNIGGTTWLVLDFCRDSVSDVMVPLIIGLMAAVLSLLAVPLAIPFFALAQRACTGWRCRLTALMVVILGFAAGNFVLLNLLPLGPVNSLLTVSEPYLVAAVLAAMWVYRPQPLLRPSRLMAVRPHRTARRVPFNWPELIH